MIVFQSQLHHYVHTVTQALHRDRSFNVCMFLVKMKFRAELFKSSLINSCWIERKRSEGSNHVKFIS